MWIDIAKIDVLNHLYHTWQTHAKLLYYHLNPCIKHNTFSDYDYCHFTIKECYSITFSSVFSFRYNVMKEHIIFILLTANSTVNMYSTTTISYYMYLHYNLYYGAPTSRSLAHPSRLLFISTNPIINSILRSCILHQTMQRQECLSDTNPDRQAHMDLSGQETSCKSHSSLHSLFCNSEVHSYVRNYADTLSLSWSDLMNLSPVMSKRTSTPNLHPFSQGSTIMSSLSL